MWSERVRRALQDELDIREVSAQSVAQHLRLPIRSLSRRLRAEGTQLSALIAEERLKRACAMLTLGSYISLDQLSDMLGFSGKTTLCRAFKRWTGVSPRRYARTFGVTLDDALDEPVVSSDNISVPPSRPSPSAARPHMLN